MTSSSFPSYGNGDHLFVHGAFFLTQEAQSLKNLYIEESRVNVHEYTSKHGVYARVLM